MRLLNWLFNTDAICKQLKHNEEIALELARRKGEPFVVFDVAKCTYREAKTLLRMLSSGRLQYKIEIPVPAD